MRRKVLKAAHIKLHGCIQKNLLRCFITAVLQASAEIPCCLVYRSDLHVNDRCTMYRARLKLLLNQHKHPLRCVKSV